MSRTPPKISRLPLALSVAFSVLFAVTAGDSKSTPVLRNATSKQILDEIHRPGAGAVLVNVWATWCIPCREEFPDLVRIHREFEKQGLRVVLVAADFEADREKQVRKFLVAHGVDFPSFLKDEKDEEFINGLEPHWSGALPVTLIYDGAGKQRNFWEGSASYVELKERVLEALDRSAEPAQAAQPQTTEEAKQTKEDR